MGIKVSEKNNPAARLYLEMRSRRACHQAARSGEAAMGAWIAAKRIWSPRRLNRTMRVRGSEKSTNRSESWTRIGSASQFEMASCLSNHSSTPWWPWSSHPEHKRMWAMGTNGLLSLRACLLQRDDIDAMVSKLLTKVSCPAGKTVTFLWQAGRGHLRGRL